MGILSWIIVGGIAGWLASIVMGTNDQQGCIIDIILGIVGGLVGGAVLGLFGAGGDLTGINLPSLLTAFIGAVILLFIKKQFVDNR